MPDTLLSDHIAMFSDALTSDYCETLIARFKAADHHETCYRENGHSFTQLDITKEWPDQQALLEGIFLRHFVAYRTATEAYFWPPEFALEHIRLKRYLPNGRDCFPPHVDVMGQVSARRFMTAMIYLNEPGDGATVFPQPNLSIVPETGKLLAFPPLWLFPHTGLPPTAEAKYILHTHLCYAS